jgi:two-component sensor histidine kinase
MQLVETLVDQLDGSLSVQSVDGTAWRMRFPAGRERAA